MNVENSIKESLAANADKLQVNGMKTISFGKQNRTQSFIDETAKAMSLGWGIKNETDKNVFIAFVPAFDGYNPTQFGSLADIRSFMGADCIFGDGVVFTKEDSEGVSKNVTISSLDSKRKIQEFVKYAGQSPLRFTKFSMNSAKNDGSKEDSNYNNRMKSFWFTPFEDTVAVDLDLRPIRQGGNNFNTDMMDINFLTQGGGFKAIMSNENGFVIQVNAGTTLTITSFIGAQKSEAQEFFRTISTADDIMAPALRQLS